MLLELLIASAIAFIVTLFSGFYIRRVLMAASIYATDINKPDKRELPASGGLVVLLGLLIGISAFLFEGRFIGTPVNLFYMAMYLSAASIATFIGFLDDVITNRIRNIKKATSKYLPGGLPQKVKLLWSVTAIIPILALTIPSSGVLFGISITLPLIVFLILEILVLIFATNVVNMLEGLNGMAIQLTFVAIFFLTLSSFLSKNYTAFAIGTIIDSAILGYMYFGVYPAKILPGDSLTYLLGLSLGAMIFLSREYTLGLILLIPWIVEFLLKARARFHAHSWGVIQKDGTLKSPHGRNIYSITHIFYNYGKFKEWQIVTILTVIEIILGIIGLVI